MVHYLHQGRPFDNIVGRGSTMREYILVADDDKTIQKFISLTLEAEGYEVMVVDNGLKALAATVQCQPALILLDMMMPIMDGWTFLQRYCEQAGARAPIIAFSANTSYASAMLCTSEFLAKP